MVICKILSPLLLYNFAYMKKMILSWFNGSKSKLLFSIQPLFYIMHARRGTSPPSYDFDEKNWIKSRSQNDYFAKIRKFWKLLKKYRFVDRWPVLTRSLNLQGIVLPEKPRLSIFFCSWFFLSFFRKYSWICWNRNVKKD